MEFVKDHRLTFQSPESYEEIELPLQVTWTMKDFEVLGAKDKQAPSEDAGYFAVFVDQAPVKPGHTLADVGKDDPLCQGDTAACLDPAYLETKGVYTTRKPSVALETVDPLSGSKEKVQLHQVTVVLLDSAGRRIGELAWYRYFKLETKVVSL